MMPDHTFRQSHKQFSSIKMYHNAILEQDRENLPTQVFYGSIYIPRATVACSHGRSWR